MAELRSIEELFNTRQSTGGKKSLIELYVAAKQATNPLLQATKDVLPEDLFKSLLDIGVRSAPVSGDILDISEFISGTEIPIIPGEEPRKLSTIERILTGIGAALPIIPGGMVRAFHGTGKAFEKFSSKFIGSGEGATAFGHGFYFTESERIAGGYAKKLGPGRGDSAKDLANRVMEATKGNKVAAIDELQNRILIPARKLQKIKTDPNSSSKIIENQQATTDAFVFKVNKAIQSIQEGTYKGRTLEVTLHPNKPEGTENWLDWYENLNDSEIGELTAELTQKERDQFNFIFDNSLSKGRAGKDVYKALSSTLGSKREASEFLSRAGIDGIRYPAGSLSGGTKSGANNFVIFDEDAIQIEGVVNDS